MRDKKGRFVKGHNLGFQKGNKQALGIRRTNEHKEILRNLKKGKFSSNKYEAMHYWIREYGPNKGECEICGVKEVWLDWANKSHEYKRDLNDWMLVCRSCHKKYDIKMGFIVYGRRKNGIK